MQVGVALVLVVWIAQIVWVVADNALHERQVVEQDGATQAPRYINPSTYQQLMVRTKATLEKGRRTYRLHRVMVGHPKVTREPLPVGVGVLIAGRRELTGKLRTSEGAIHSNQ